MGRVETFEGVRADTLPEEMRVRLGLGAETLVRVTVEAPRTRKPVDEEKLAKLLAEIRALPVLDDRPADELLGYNEDGLFD